MDVLVQETKLAFPAALVANTADSPVPSTVCALENAAVLPDPMLVELNAFWPEPEVLPVVSVVPLVPSTKSWTRGSVTSLRPVEVVAGAVVQRRVRRAGIDAVDEQHVVAVGRLDVERPAGQHHVRVEHADRVGAAQLAAHHPAHRHGRVGRVDVVVD